MSYAYCARCDAPMNEPTLTDVWFNTWQCSEGHLRKLSDPERIELLAGYVSDLHDRIERLEAKP